MLRTLGHFHIFRHEKTWKSNGRPIIGRPSKRIQRECLKNIFRHSRLFLSCLGKHDFPISFLKPATINSIHSFIPENRKPHIHPIYFLLKFRHALFNPFQGFWNSDTRFSIRFKVSEIPTRAFQSVSRFLKTRCKELKRFQGFWKPETAKPTDQPQKRLLNLGWSIDQP